MKNSFKIGYKVYNQKLKNKISNLKNFTFTKKRCKNLFSDKSKVK